MALRHSSWRWGAVGNHGFISGTKVNWGAIYPLTFATNFQQLLGKKIMLLKRQPHKTRTKLEKSIFSFFNT